MLPQRNEWQASKEPKEGKTSILLTGASGTLGRALAMQHAAPGAHLALWGRDSDKLSETAQIVSALGAHTSKTRFDLMDALGAAHEVAKQDQIHLFDIAYLAAGIGETRAPGQRVEEAEQVARAVQVNFTAPAAMATTLAGRMAERGNGRLVLIGSAAGHHSLPSANAYSGTKAGLARFADALRLAVKPHGVSVTLAAPGFIDTPAARARGENLPFKLPVDEAARRIVRAGERRARHYVTPWPFHVVRALDRLLPPFLRDSLLTRLDG